MSSKAARKGKQFERDVAAYLRDMLEVDVRRGQAGRVDDIGDLFGIDDWTFELKNRKDVAGALRDGVDESIQEWITADTEFFAAIIKRRQRHVSDAYAVMPLWQLARIIERLELGL